MIRATRPSLLVLVTCAAVVPAMAQTVVRGKVVHTMGPAGSIADGVVVIENGKIKAVGPAASTTIPSGAKVLEAAVVTPGLIDAHATVGLSGLYNQRHDSDQIEHSSSMQPELRALDAYNPQERLIEWVRSFGVTTVHTGHAPGELISGQTLLVKTVGKTAEQALLREPVTIAATLGPESEKDGNKSPGTRGKQLALLRAELIKTQEYVQKRKAASQPAGDSASAPASDQSEHEADESLSEDEKKRKAKSNERNLRSEVLARVLAGELPLMITCNRAQDIANALRLAEEFKIRIWLDSAAESYILLDEIKQAGVPVISHPLMYRAVGERENQSFETIAKLKQAGIPVALQSGYETYVPKTRVVLFEAAIAAANGLTFEQALATITIDAARILGVADRLGSLEAGKDADMALYDGDPFEYTSHCTSVLINGQVVSEQAR